MYEYKFAMKSIKVMMKNKIVGNQELKPEMNTSSN